MKINREQKLYVFNSNGYVSCLGFEVAEKRRVAVLEWLGKPVEKMRLGTKKHYNAYHDAMMAGFAHHDKTKQKCTAELEPRLTGLEGKRVEVIAPDGYKSRFYVGRSSGWMPCHIEIKQSNSSGGCAAYIPSGATIRAV